MESVILPLSLTTIGSEAFSSCESLTEINIPESVISFGDNPFSFTTLKFTGKYASDNGKCLIKDGELVSFGTADGAISYSVPNNVIAIGPSALAATGLQSIIIPESVKTIGKEAFRNNVALKSISIPKSVTSIDQWAFYDCTSLKDIYCYPILPPSLGVDAFYFTGDNKIIHVVESSLTAYKTNWSQYKNIIVGDITE